MKDRVKYQSVGWVITEKIVGVSKTTAWLVAQGFEDMVNNTLRRNEEMDNTIEKTHQHEEAKI